MSVGYVKMFIYVLYTGQAIRGQERYVQFIKSQLSTD